MTYIKGNVNALRGYSLYIMPIIREYIHWYVIVMCCKNQPNDISMKFAPQNHDISIEIRRYFYDISNSINFNSSNQTADQIFPVRPGKLHFEYVSNGSPLFLWSCGQPGDLWSRV